MDRNTFIPPRPRSTFDLTLGMFLIVLAGIVVGIALLAMQLSAFASPVPATAMPFVPIANEKHNDRLASSRTCRAIHFLRFDDAGTLAHAELIADCPNEEPHAVLRADCADDPVGCSIVLSTDLNNVPNRAVDPVDLGPSVSLPPYGGADIASLSMIGRAY